VITAAPPAAQGHADPAPTGSVCPSGPAAASVAPGGDEDVGPVEGRGEGDVGADADRGADVGAATAGAARSPTGRAEAPAMNAQSSRAALARQVFVSARSTVAT